MELQFNSPEDYDKLEAGFFEEEFEYSDGSKVKVAYPTITIPEGTIVHRSERNGETNPSVNFPAFFGNMESIEIYSRKNPNAYSHYTFKKDALLIVLSYETLEILKIHPALNEYYSTTLNDYFVKDNNWMKQYVIPVNYNPINIEKVQKGNKKVEELLLLYSNRILANFICGYAGFDGWIVKPLNEEKKEGMIQFTKSNQVFSEYPPEIMLCKWDEFLEPIGSNKKTSNILPKSKLNGSTEGGRKHRTYRKKKSKSTHKKRK